MAKGTTSFIATVLLIALAAAAVRDDAFWHLKTQVSEDAISTPCDPDAICTLEFYNTSYSTCEGSNPGEILPAYSNCCVLSSCVANATTCVLHLQDDEGVVECTF